MNSISIDIDLLIKHRYKLIIFFLLALCVSIFTINIVPEKNLANRIILFDDTLTKTNILAEKALVKSDGVISRVVDKIDLNLTKQDQTEINKEELFKQYRKKLTIFHYPNTNVFKLTASSRNANTANQIVKKHIDEYLKFSMERRTEAQNTKIELIKSELKDAEDNFTLKKNILIKFATQNNISLNLHLDENNLYEVTLDPKNNPSLKSPNLEVELDLLKRNYKIYRGIVLGLRSRLETQKIEDSLIPPIAKLLDVDVPTTKETSRVFLAAVVFSLIGFILSLGLELLARIYRKTV